MNVKATRVSGADGARYFTTTCSSPHLLFCAFFFGSAPQWKTSWKLSRTTYAQDQPSRNLSKDAYIMFNTLLVKAADDWCRISDKFAFMALTRNVASACLERGWSSWTSVSLFTWVKKIDCQETTPVQYSYPSRTRRKLRDIITPTSTSVRWSFFYRWTKVEVVKYHKRLLACPCYVQRVATTWSPGCDSRTCLLYHQCERMQLQYLWSSEATGRTYVAWPSRI